MDKRYVPAIGGQLRVSPIQADIPVLQLPPSPHVPESTRPAFPPLTKSYETDPETLLPGMVDDLTAVVHAWHLDQDHAARPTENGGSLLTAGDAGSPPRSTFDVLGVLKITTSAIRSVRNYVLSLPDESTGTIRAQFRSRSLGPSRSRPTLSVPQSSASSQPDPLTLIRRAALEVLTVLRALEESCRVPLSDDAYDAQSDGGGGHSRMASPSNVSEELPPEDGEPVHVHEVDPDTSITFLQVQGRYESVPVWEDEEGGMFSDEETEKREGWDERLVLGSGWLYRQDISVDTLVKEKAVVGAYLDVVDEVLFNGKNAVKGQERGWEREKRKVLEKAKGSKSKRRRTSAGDVEGRSLGVSVAPDGGKRRVSTGMVNLMSSMKLTEEPEEMPEISEEMEESEESVEEDELPEWARRHVFMDNELGLLFRFSR